MHDHDRGLSWDLSTLMTRRRALRLAAVGGLAAVVGCGSSGDGSGAATTAATTAERAPATTATASASATEIPEETAGPYPADGSNGPNVLAESGVVRGDITSSFAGSSGTAQGVPLTIDLTILDVAAGGAPLGGAALYLWHCDREGRYSIYDIPSENYLRASAGAKLVTSQIALPADACGQVYATAGYEQSAQNLAGLSLDTDMVFSDGDSTQLGTAAGSPSSGMTLALNVGV